MGKHTPGPWLIESDSESNPSMPHRIVAMDAIRRKSQSGTSSRPTYLGLVNSIDDARLISAAPDMAEALRALMAEALRALMIAYGASDGRNGNSGECWDKARAALKKAGIE